MIYTIYPKPLSGIVNAPSSKSITHRVLICASFANEQSIIEHPLICDDTLTTIKALENIGVTFKYNNNKLQVIPPTNYKLKSQIIECNSSGSTIRMLMPLFSSLFDSVVFKGSEKLIERVKNNDLSELNLNYSFTTNSITLSKNNIINNLTLHDDSTSQLISGQILLIAILRKQGILHIISKNENLNPYILLTLNILESFGVNYKINKDNNLYTIHINPHLTSSYNILNKPLLNSVHYYVEGDYSSSANLLALGLLGNDVIVKNLYKTSIQGDKKFLEIITQMSGELEIGIDAIKANHSNLTNTLIDLNHIPDLGPILIALASVSNGTSTFINFKKLKFKESNRLKQTIKILTDMGAKIVLKDNLLKVTGQKCLEGGTIVDPLNDHRLAMMASVIACKCNRRITILNTECVSKSYPNYWNDYRNLSGILIETNLKESNDKND